MTKSKTFVITLFILILALSSLAQAEVVVSSKQFTEQIILGKLTYQVLDYHGIPVVDQTNLMGSLVVRTAQEVGEVDLYWEYTGTALITHLGFDEAITDPERCYEVVKTEDLKRNNLVWLDYTPFNNTYTLMMREADVDGLGITTISELAAAINSGKTAPIKDGWVFASNHEYSIRDDGYVGLNELYGFEFDRVVIMDLGITYAALRDGKVMVALGFATDGRIDAFGLVNLQDDQFFHPVYNAAPVVRGEVLDKYPEIADILNPIAAAIDTETMSGLNAMVDIEGYEPEEVAREWLLEHGFIK